MEATKPLIQKSMERTCKKKNDGMTSTELQRLVPENLCKQTLDDWRDSAVEYGPAELFDNKKSSSQMKKAGSTVPSKKLVHAYINISGVERASSFWVDKGGNKLL
jgi:hypothetical protein